MAFSFKKIFSRLTNPAPLTQGRWLQAGRNIHVSENSAMQVSAYYRGAIYLATQLAKIAWYIKDAEDNEVKNSIYYLLNVAPNKETTAFSFKVAMILASLNHGNGYAEIERDNIGRPLALWFLNPRDVTVARNPVTLNLEYRVSSGGSYVVMQPKNILHFRNLHTLDGLTGLGLVDYATKVLRISIGADDMAGSLFENSGLPSGVLQAKGKLSDEAYARMKKSWHEAYGKGKSGSVAVLEEEVTFHPLDIDPQMLQFLESRKFGVIEIARFFGVAPAKLYDTGAATYSNVEQANLEVQTDTLDAWAAMMNNEVDVKLLGSQFAGKYSELCIFDVKAADSKTRMEYFKARMSMGTISINEIRRAEGEPDIEGGDRYFIATNNYTPLDRIDDVLDSQIKPAPIPTKDVTPPPKEIDAPAKDDELTNALITSLSR